MEALAFPLGGCLSPGVFALTPVLLTVCGALEAVDVVPRTGTEDLTADAGVTDAVVGAEVRTGGVAAAAAGLATVRWAGGGSRVTWDRSAGDGGGEDRSSSSGVAPGSAMSGM